MVGSQTAKNPACRYYTQHPTDTPFAAVLIPRRCFLFFAFFCAPAFLPSVASPSLCFFDHPCLCFCFLYKCCHFVFLSVCLFPSLPLSSLSYFLLSLSLPLFLFPVIPVLAVFKLCFLLSFYAFFVPFLPPSLPPSLPHSLLPCLPSCIPPVVLPSFLHSFLPSFLPSCLLPCLLSCFLLSLIPSYLLPFLLSVFLLSFPPSFLSSFLPAFFHSPYPSSFLAFFLRSCLPSVMPPVFIPSLLPSFLCSLLFLLASYNSSLLPSCLLPSCSCLPSFLPSCSVSPWGTPKPTIKARQKDKLGSMKTFLEAPSNPASSLPQLALSVIPIISGAVSPVINLYFVSPVSLSKYPK